MSPADSNDTRAVSLADITGGQRQAPVAAEPRAMLRTVVTSVVTASLTIMAVEQITDLQHDWIVALLMLAVAAITIMVVLTSMLIRNSRQALAMAEALRRQNEQLAQTTKLLNEAQRVGRLGHWMTVEDDDSAVWSEELFEITGLEPSPSISFATMAEIIHPEDVSNYIRARDRARATGGALKQDLRIVRPDGEIRWIRVVADPMDDLGSGFRERFGIVQDITERKLAEIAADQARQLLVDAIEALTKGFVLFDKDDRFVLSNTRFREMFPGWASLMRPGISFTDVLRKAHEHGLMRPKGDGFEDWLARKRAWHLGGSRMVEHRELNGRWIQSVDHRISDGGTVCLMTDITAFKTVQAELEQKLAYVEAIRSDLERQTRELEATGAELRAARDAAEAANRAKSDFLAIMSHEIRTPLSGMVGMIELLRGTSLTEEQKRYTVLAKESAELLLEVINDILDFSKLEAGRLQSECIDFDVPNLVESAASFMGEKARKRSLDLTVSLAPGLPRFLKGDPTRIRQVMLNLTANAIKFTEQGSIELRAAHHEQGDGAIVLRIEVIDTGIGMSAEIQAQIFDPFVQADTSISRKYGGSGLGLAICKQLCAIMGGSIGVDSEPGRGSRFWFEAMCQPGEEPLLQGEPVMLSADRPLEILVAEDSPIIATLIHSLLVKQGYRPTMVDNGVKAVAAVSEKHYDLVLMDVQMPEMDGISATQAIRQLPGAERHVPIIALTANALVGQRETYLAAGMNDYVTKPIQPPLLFDAIRRWALPQYADAPPLQPGRLDMFVS
ncbi:ATP-binding protein [Bradyrhizobium sp. USDA 4353]